jgi:DNA-binding transcriptional regulator YhcF (GntR family)
MIKPEKAKQLIDYLEERVVAGQYSNGSKIPSVRRLADKFNVSYGTALRGIDYLCEQGKFEKVANRGVFVRKSLRVASNNKVRRIAVFMEPYATESPQGMCYTAFLGMQELALKAGFTFIVNPLMIENATEDIIYGMSDGAEGIILLNEYDYSIKELTPKVPVVGVLMDNSYNGSISTVNLDAWSVARMAAEFFESKKLKRVVIISSFKPVFVTRGITFAALWREKGFECEFITEYNYSNEEIDYDKNCGYLFTSDQNAQNHSLKFMEENGIELAKRFTILGMDGKQLIDPNFHRFPSIAVDWKAIGEIAFNECLSRINNPASIPKNISLTGKKMFLDKSN